jgi:hypothetical protein
MGTFNIGVNKEGNLAAQKELKSLLVTKPTDILKGKKYTKAIDAIKKAWTGEDAEIFLANFKKTMEQTCNGLLQYHKDIQSMMNMTEDEFVAFRKSHVKPE